MLVSRRHSRPKPANRSAVPTARSAVDALARAQQEKTINALAVEGYPCQYYARKRLGTTCTCSQTLGPGTVPVLPTTPGVHVLDAEGNASPNHIRAMLQGSRISIDRYGTRMAGQGAPDDFLEPRRLPGAGTDSLDQHNKTTDGGDDFAEILEPDDDLDALLDVDGTRGGNTMLQIQGSSGCGVCLGTSFVGGYNFANGHRVVYDTQHPWAVNGFVLDESQAPHVWRQINSPAQAQLFVMLPRGLRSVRAARLWNNKQVVTGYDLEVMIENSWVPVTARSLLDAADGQLHAIRITCLQADMVFTHLELSFDLNLSPLYVEWNRMTETDNPRLPENIEPVSIVISPSMPVVRMRDVLIEDTYKRVWMLTSVTNLKDRQSRPHGWEGQARLVQSFEFPQLLSNSFSLHRHQEFTNALIPGVDNENWSGHEDTPTG